MAKGNFLKVGVIGSESTGVPWDEKGRADIVQIFIWHNQKGIAAIQFQYVENGRLSLSDRHGATAGQNNFNTVKLNYPSERITWIIGRPTWNYEGVVSLKILTNCREYGPFGKENGSYRELCSHELVGDQFGGFYGSATSDNLASIGVYIKLITTLGLDNKTANKRLKKEC